MVRFLLFLVVLFALAFGFHQLKITSGEVALTVGDTAYAVDLTTAVIGLVALFLVTAGLLWFIRELFRSPRRLSRGWRQRNAERGRQAISQGLIAVAAGDLRSAERAMLEASRRSPDMPLARLLEAQTAQLRGDRAGARRVFQDMTADPQTRIAGLRGLFIEAEREGELEAAYRIAERAREESPSAPWAARGLLRHQTAAHDWDGALRTLSAAADGGILDKRTARRQRAVMLAAQAIDLEQGEPDRARQAALQAHELAPDLVPAATVAGRLLARQGDVRRATRLLEETWKVSQHPEVAEAYLHVRSGDSASDRLKRAEALFRLRPHSDDGRLAVARAAIEARDFERAREMLAPILTERPTQRALTIMAELEEADSGDRGRAREWLARAVRAPRDPAWTADGVILDAWAPASPVTGRLDTVEWKVPVAELEPPSLHIEAEDLRPAAVPVLVPMQDPEPLQVEEPAAAAAAPGPEVSGPAEGVDGAPVEEEGSALPIGTLPDHADAIDPALAGDAESKAAPEPASAAGQAANGSGHPPGAAKGNGSAPHAAEDPENAAVAPRLPDDPGVAEDEPATDKSRFRLF
jgi:HemY protein